MGMRELVALLSLSSWRLVSVVWLSLAVPWVCLQFVIVVFPDHTYLLFFNVFWLIQGVWNVHIIFNLVKQRLQDQFIQNLGSRLKRSSIATFNYLNV